jgi:hypothetical protein
MILTLIREEMSGAIASTLSEPLTTPEVSHRQASLARLAVLRAEAVSIEARQSETHCDAERIAQLEAELDEMRQRVRVHHSQRQAEYFANWFAVDRELVMLRSTCSSQIGAFIEAMNAEQARLCRLVPITEFGFGEKDLFAANPKTPRLTYSSAPAIGRRLAAVVAARSRAEELKVLDRTEEELRAELENLQAALPVIDGVLELVRE